MGEELKMDRVAVDADEDRRSAPRWVERVCAWCEQPASKHPVGPHEIASHGICDSCLAELLAALRAGPRPS